MKTIIPKSFAFVAIATIGFERMNLLPMSGSFVQPYYLLAAPFVALIWLRPCNEFLRFYALALLVMAASLTVNGYHDAYHWKKFILVGFVLAATFGLASYLCARGGTELLAKSLKTYVLLNVAITLLQLVFFFNGRHISTGFDAGRFLNLDAVVIGDYFRLSGYSLDANKGVFNFAYALTFLTLIAGSGWTWLKVAYPLTFFAHSRSTLISMLFGHVQRSRVYVVVTIGLYLAVLCFLTPHGVLADRVGSSCASAATEHAVEQWNPAWCSNQTRSGLIELWISAITKSSWSQLALGHGFASSGQYLNRFLETPYGDFANGYLTLAYEMGLAGIVLVGVLFFRLWKLLRKSDRGMLLLPLAAFQLFYSNLGEPLVILVLSYFFIQQRAASESLPNSREV